jgi:heme oxygenase (biliverdin-IX-beta and delta-forming)
MTCRIGEEGVSRHALLRGATQAQHDAAEAAVEAQGFLASRERYALFLARSLAFHAALEGRAEAAGAARLLPDWPLRRKAGLLRADLAALGAGPDRLPAPLSLPPPPATGSPTAALLGALYVAEGATLGGAVLGRRAAAALGVGPGRGASFLNAYGPARGARWRGFLEALERADLGPGAEEGLVAAARATFAAYVESVAGGGDDARPDGRGGGAPSPASSGKVSSHTAPASG